VDKSLPESVTLALRDILFRYSDVFSKLDGDIGLTTEISHQIDTADAKPIRQPLRRYPPVHRKAISQQVEDYLKHPVLGHRIWCWLGRRMAHTVAV